MKKRRKPNKVVATTTTTTTQRVPELELRDGEPLFAERRPGENAANFMRRAGLEMVVL